MIQVIGLLISFYVGMRGLDWLVVSREATHKSVRYGRIVVGILTMLGAGFFGALLIASSATVPTSAPSTYENYNQ